MRQGLQLAYQGLNIVVSMLRVDQCFSRIVFSHEGSCDGGLGDFTMWL